jgi:hypothetical protein
LTGGSVEVGPLLVRATTAVRTNQATDNPMDIRCQMPVVSSRKDAGIASAVKVRNPLAMMASASRPVARR